MESGSQPSVGPNFIKAFVPGLIVGLLVGSLVSAFVLPMLTEKAPAPTGKGTVVVMPSGPRDRENVVPADDKGDAGKMIEDAAKGVKDAAKDAAKDVAPAVKPSDAKPPEAKPHEGKPSDPAPAPPKTPG